MSNDGQDAATYEARRRRLQEAHGNGNGAGLVLAQAVQRDWPTPSAVEPSEDAEKWEARRAAKAEEGINLQAKLSTVVQRTAWPTATAGDAVGAGNRNLPGSKAHAGTSLTDAVNGGQAPRRETWASASASASDWKGSKTADQRKGQLSSQTEPGGVGALNPDWVETLMGWPVGWTSLDPLAEVVFSPWPAPPGPQHPWEPPRLAPRVPGRTARLRMLGNGQVPATAVLAWRVLGGGA